MGKIIEEFKFFYYLFTHKNPVRYYKLWKRTLENDYLFQMKQPWLVLDATSYLDSIDLKNKLVFEWGSGGSTLYWLSRQAQVVSIEHDKKWYDQMKTLTINEQKLDLRNIIQDDLKYNNNFDPSNPSLYQSLVMPSNSFKKYVCQIDDFSDNYFDIILIDGRSRASCLKHSISKVKEGGLIILDNSNRTRYLTNTNSLLKFFYLIQFKGLVPGNKTISMTNIYQKLPKEKIL